jgi:8-oxo-dGTP pyrophosphatase MutT (NUDIX family)
MSEVSPKRIAAAVLQRPDGRVLLLKRAPTHTTNPDKWCFVTGYVNPGEDPRDAAIRELREELGLDVQPARAGEIVVVHTAWATLHVYPFLFPVDVETVDLDWEHTAYAWILPEELYGYDFVQQLDDDLIALGLLPADFTDHQGRAIRLTGERREHVLKHLEMVGQFHRIRETLADPELVVATRADDTVHVYHKYYDKTPVTRKFLLVAVKVLKDDAFVLTAFFSSRQKEGKVIWQR